MLSMEPTFPTLTAFSGSGLDLASKTFIFKSFKISAACWGDLAQIICKLGKCKVNKVIFETKL